MTPNKGTSTDGLYLALSNDVAPTITTRRGSARSPRRLERRRLAILYADVAGYSRLMCRDEESTHCLLDRHLDILGAHVLANGGTICHYAGDAMLACFPSAAEAMTCAVEAQQELARRNRRVRHDRRLQFRVGLNLADVILARGEIFGVGVNVAARLQALAAPGGVCLSESFHDSLAGNSEDDFVALGECWLKNIDKPVRAWRFRMDRRPVAASSRPPRRAALAAALHVFASTPAVHTPRERVLPGPRINALRNLSLVEDAAGGDAIHADLGRRDIGPRRRDDADGGVVRLCLAAAPEVPAATPAADPAEVPA